MASQPFSLLRDNKLLPYNRHDIWNMKNTFKIKTQLFIDNILIIRHKNRTIHL